MDRREYIKNTALALGLGISGTSLSSIFMSCSKEVNLTWKPLFLSPLQASLIEEITETILPKTKTPGAKELGVPQFIDKVVGKTMKKDNQKAFVENLDNFDKSCQQQYAKGFLELDASQKNEFLLALDKASPPSAMSVWGINLEPNLPNATFYKQLKALTLTGYYTSKEVGEHILGYDAVPGEFIPCVPVKGMNSWNE